MNILELKGIHKTYRRGGFWGNREKIEVLKGIDLKIEKGSCIGLLGRSGSGKSTLGRMALDLEKPDKGEILYCGKPLQSLSKTEYRNYRRNVQVVFQNPLGSVNPRFTAFQIVAEPLSNYESELRYEIKEMVEELLNLVGLSSSDFDKYPHQFSGGQLQRVCIARAIALDPGLIILDEAVSSLDMLIQLKIVDLLIKLKEELKTTYLFISHDIRVLLKMSDRILVMDDGKLVEHINNDAENGEVIHHPAFKKLVDAILPSMPERARMEM